MGWIADESVDFRIIEKLRESGYRVEAIVESVAGVDDDQVLKIANEKGWILLTEDKDFGELTYRLKKPNRGILLLRLSGVKIDDKIRMVVETIENHGDDIADAFAVLSKNKLRIKQ